MRIALKTVGIIVCVMVVAGLLGCATTSKGQVFRYQSDSSVQTLIAGTPADNNLTINLRDGSSTSP